MLGSLKNPLSSSSVFFLYFTYKADCTAKKTIYLLIFYFTLSHKHNSVYGLLGIWTCSILHPFMLLACAPLLRSHMKSFEIASTKLGADMRMEMVQMMLKTLNATRHKRSMTAPANFHWSAALPASSCSRKRSAM